MRIRYAWQRAWALIRMDAARWVWPEKIGDATRVTTRDVLRYAFKYLGMRAVLVLRLASFCHEAGIRGVPSLLQRRLLLRYGLEIPPAGRIGGGLYIAHPVACVLVADSIGENVTVIGAVTMGRRGHLEFPTVGDRVFLGAGAKVIGAITIGDDAVVGANAVVTRDVAPGVTVVGVPARPIPGT